VQHVLKIQYLYLLKKYKKWGVLRVAVCPSYTQDARFLKVNSRSLNTGSIRIRTSGSF
jgi:hypothetical protein